MGRHPRKEKINDDDLVQPGSWSGFGSGSSLGRGSGHGLGLELEKGEGLEGEENEALRLDLVFGELKCKGELESRLPDFIFDGH